MTSIAVADRQTRMNGQTRLQVSTTARTHNRRPSKSSSCIQSIAHTWLGPVALLRSLRKLGHDAAAWRFVPHLQALQIVEPPNALHVHMPTFATEQHMDASVAVTHSLLGNLSDALSQGRLLGSAGSIMVGRARCRNSSACSTNRHAKHFTDKVDHLASPNRRHSLRRITSCSISLSSVRSATTLGNLAFSSSSWRSFVTSDGLSHRRAASSDKTLLPRCPSAGTPRQWPFRSPPAEAQMLSAAQGTLISSSAKPPSRVKAKPDFLNQNGLTFREEPKARVPAAGFSKNWRLSARQTRFQSSGSQRITRLWPASHLAASGKLSC